MRQVWMRSGWLRLFLVSLSLVKLVFVLFGAPGQPWWFYFWEYGLWLAPIAMLWWARAGWLEGFFWLINPIFLWPSNGKEKLAGLALLLGLVLLRKKRLKGWQLGVFLLLVGVVYVSLSGGINWLDRQGYSDLIVTTNVLRGEDLARGLGIWARVFHNKAGLLEEGLVRLLAVFDVSVWFAGRENLIAPFLLPFAPFWLWFLLRGLFKNRLFIFWLFWFGLLLAVKTNKLEADLVLFAPLVGEAISEGVGFLKGRWLVGFVGLCLVEILVFVYLVMSLTWR